MFVANFLGDTNLINGTSRVTPDGVSLLVNDCLVPCRTDVTVPDAVPAALSIRPEDVRLQPAGAPCEGYLYGDAVVIDRTFMGARLRTTVQADDGKFVVESGADDFAAEPGSTV